MTKSNDPASSDKKKQSADDSIEKRSQTTGRPLSPVPVRQPTEDSKKKK